jgi:hypothetical protein
MNPMLRTFRRIALTMSGLTFAVIGVLAFAMPQTVARIYGFTLDGIDGLSEFRAIYTGFWLSLGFTMITAARREDVPLLGDICGVMLLAQALGRLASFAVDGRPGLPFIAAFVAELASALTIFAPRLLSARASMRAPLGAL